MTALELKECFVPTEHPGPVTILVPQLNGGFRTVQGHLLGAMFARGIVHHLRVEDRSGLTWTVPVAWVATKLDPRAFNLEPANQGERLYARR